MAFIKIVEPAEAEGRLQEIYNDLVTKRGKIAEVHKITSLNPETIVAHMDLYLMIMFGQSSLKRVQREMIGVVVSIANNCEYCQRHHSAAMNTYWKNDEQIEAFLFDFKSVELDDIDRELCNLAWQLTRFPSNDISVPIIEKLKELGLDDRAILDATLVVGYFNFVNRIVLGLGVQLEEDKGEGYKY